jgi:acyl-CoA hydrolase
MTRPVKNVSESITEMTELVLPNDTNLLGNLLGGRLMHWIDIAGAIAATRHADNVVATVSVDQLDFKQPIKVGSIVTLKAELVKVGMTSMKVMVDVFTEGMTTNEKTLTNESFLTYVALDSNGKKTVVPLLSHES